MQLDLNQIQLPQKFEEQFNETIRNQRKRNKTILIEQGYKDEELEKTLKEITSDKTYDPVEQLETAINNALNEWMNIKHYDESKKTVIAPWDVRKKVSKIHNRVMESESGQIELSKELADFLLEVLKSDLSPNDYYFYLTMHLEELVHEQDKKET